MNAIEKAVSLEELALEQKTDEELKAILLEEKGLHLSRVQLPGAAGNVFCDSNSSLSRPFVPKTLRRRIFLALHSLSHPGTKASARLVAQRYVWPEMQRDCMAWARACVQCQKSKVTRHNKSSIGNFVSPTRRFEHIHTDIVGPLPDRGDIGTV